MAATLTTGYTYGATELVTSTKMNLQVNGATISGIVNAEISSSASIDLSKLAGGQLVFFNGDLVSYEDNAVTYA
jgi:hypothetical protein